MGTAIPVKRRLGAPGLRANWLIEFDAYPILPIPVGLVSRSPRLARASQRQKYANRRPAGQSGSQGQRVHSKLSEHMQ